MDEIKRKPSPQTPQVLDYQVMPKPSEQQASSAPEEKILQPPGGLWGHRKLLVTILGLIVLGIIGYFAYALFANKEKAASPAQSTAENISVTPPVTVKDSDSDGLNDDRELGLATDPQKPDSDGDGLADGDEVNVYGSSPLLSDTDSDGYKDGVEVRDGYSPTANSREQAATDELQIWADHMAQYGLHMPTKTTINVTVSTGSADQKTIYTNSKFAYSFELPGLLKTRESDDSRNVGLYIEGASLDDEDVTTDPIFITAAVKVAGQTLKQWADSQYPQSAGYQSMEEMQISQLPAIRITGVVGESCNSNMTLFSKGDTVIILTLQCNNVPAFATLYADIVGSFKFQ